MKQAILLMAHNNLWTLNKIIQCLDYNKFDIYVHLDKKSSISFEDVYETKYSKLYFFKKIDVRWGDYSQVECELFLMTQALENGEYMYFHLISGADMPIKSPRKIYEFFNNNYPKEFISYASELLPKNKEKYYNKYNLFMKNYRKNNFVKVLNNAFVATQIFINRNYKKNILVGANWFSITNDLCKYVVSKEQEIRRRYMFTRSPDESFLQTITYESKFKNNIYDKNFDDNISACMRLIDWNRGTPYTFKIFDYKDIMLSNMMFVRKVDENVDRELIEKISNSILNEKEQYYEKK